MRPVSYRLNWFGGYHPAHTHICGARGGGGHLFIHSFGNVASSALLICFSFLLIPLYPFKTHSVDINNNWTLFLAAVQHMYRVQGMINRSCGQSKDNLDNVGHHEDFCFSNWNSDDNKPVRFNFYDQYESLQVEKVQKVDRKWLPLWQKVKGTRPSGNKLCSAPEVHFNKKHPITELRI